MLQYTAILEQGDDQTWSAYTLSPSLVIGTGTTKADALSDLRVAMSFWLDFLRESGQSIPASTTEVVTFEVAA